VKVSFLKKYIVFSGLLTIVGCAPAEAPQAPATLDTQQAPVIYGEDDRQDYHEAQEERWRALVRQSIVALVPAGRIDESNPEDIRLGGAELGASFGLCEDQRFRAQRRAATCSGTLIDDDLVLTAGHCVDNLQNCQENRYVFSYYEEEPGALAPLTSQEVYRCQGIAARINNNNLDYAIVRLDRPVEGDKRPAPIKRLDEALAPGDGVTLIGFPSGIPAKIAQGGFVVNPRAETLDYFEASVDAFGGNSGSGVFDANGDLVGVLVRGEQDYTQRDGCAVVNALPQERTVEEGAEDITYAARALEALCARDWPSERLCGGVARGLCFSCAEDAQCREGWACGVAPEGATRTCGPRCAQDADCRADHACAEGVCAPRVELTCQDGAVWELDRCGRQRREVQACVDAEFCFEGACAARGPGDRCDDAVALEPVTQRIEGDMAGIYAADLRGSCAGNGAERVFSLTLDRPRRVRATAVGADPVLHLRALCDDPQSEVACNDDNNPPGGNGAFLERILEPGAWFLILDSFRGAGPYTLDLAVDPVCEVYCDPDALRCADGDVVERCVLPPDEECAAWTQEDPCAEGQFCRDGACLTPGEGDACEDAIALEPVAQTLSGDLRGPWRNLSRGACGGDGPERVFSLTLERPAQLVATASGSDTVLYLRDACQEAQELACNDDNDPPGELGSRLTAVLPAGTSWLFLDTFNDRRAGEWNLALTFEAPCEDACALGARRCAAEADGVELCVEGPLGCAAWAAPLICERAFSCQEGFCAPACQDSCQEGESRCDGDGAVSTCRAFGEDGCFDWGAATACPAAQVCLDGACADPPAEPEPDLGPDPDLTPDAAPDLDGEDASPDLPGDAEDDVQDTENKQVSVKGSGGCQAAPGRPAGAVWVWAALGALLLRRRRQVCGA
jgi:uncharacterized protein (TIGR03382 family)